MLETFYKGILIILVEWLPITENVVFSFLWVLCFQSNRFWDKLSFRACSLYSTVDESSDELESSPTRKKSWPFSFFFFSFFLFFPPTCPIFPPTWTCEHILFFIFFFPTSQKIPCQDLSTVEYSECALTSNRLWTDSDFILTGLNHPKCPLIFASIAKNTSNILTMPDLFIQKRRGHGSKIKHQKTMGALVQN